MSGWTPQDENLSFQLVEVIRFFNQKGWSPATSTNYSLRTSIPNEIMISKSGVDKLYFSQEDLIKIDLEGKIAPDFQGPGIKSSAETEIHTWLYKKFPETNCVLHTHSTLGTALSMIFASEKKISFDGLEILKGLEGNTTHNLKEILPIVPNSQDMKDIICDMEIHFKENPSIHGFLIAGHGLYTWGKDLFTTKRHIETYEFLFEVTKAMGK
ncbi:MAG: methylthioribulose 1-phosphate dehydratase [Bacteriovoracaceae bacterium]